MSIILLAKIGPVNPPKIDNWAGKLRPQDITIPNATIRKSRCDIF